MAKIVLGLDWGEKHLGLAIGDLENRLATPLGAVQSRMELAKIIQQEKPGLIVIGVPANLADGRFSASDSYRSFFSWLKDIFSGPVEKIDERLTSRAASALFLSAQTKSRKNHATAAMLILQTYFDRPSRTS
ncbi:Holliday junction resolvase RuvX [Candidatus Falkowbacteria bacterium CG_4_10_14_0_2_um_filter_48_10]|uniref:Putative pre-16S rRNA nuclease n=1 Tax=Candidatus Falkowbacteria bacterium CG23_combo_of_CG06-09_8_20_14_all_49_15 TaxID=1974572 RepID=A0A2G9ZJX0_9BACT|nr:MAG: Holliday junction resolvase RuvX [Candidatus Falkowbacteria bacterium CG23_combo_of_CG06-09_8_20_14_all_49_15]PJA07710.1 MAG: Holliday junction resolvase RuvX [Candidatus Falkowbacteria bacterium CG_4_10_14_0_2_um_filter_48_10]